MKRLYSHWQALINNHSLFTPTTLKLRLRGKQYLFPRQGAQSSLSLPLTPYSQSCSRAQPLPTTRWEGAPNLQRKQWRLNNTFMSAISSECKYTTRRHHRKDEGCSNSPMSKALKRTLMGTLIFRAFQRHTWTLD